MKPRSSSEETVKQSKLFTGLANLKVLAVNPNMEELKKLGIEPKKEPEYTNIVLGEGSLPVNKIIFYLGGDIMVYNKEGIKVKETFRPTRLEFVVSDREQVSKTNKNQYINKFGLASWNSPEEVAANPKMEWFNKPPFRKACVGEEILLRFVKNWLNLKPNEDEVAFKDVKKLFGGDITELKQLVKDAAKNEVTVYLDVKAVEDDKGKTNYYQEIYNKEFSRPIISNPQQTFAKTFQESDWTKPKTPFKSFDLRVFEQPVKFDTPDDDSHINMGRSASDFV
jgi:hypothetical protein